MKELDDLNEAAQKVIEATQALNDKISAEIFEQAPFIIHNRFCARLVEIMKAKGEHVPNENPDTIAIMQALDVLEDLYPHLKNR